MNPIFIRILSIIFALIVFIALPHLSFAGNYWTEWLKLDDTALSGIDFSYSNDCQGKDSGTCTMLWKWRNRYADTVEIDYKITYDTADGKKVKSGKVKLSPGENDSPSFVVTGKSFVGVNVGIIASKQAIEKVRKQIAQQKAKEERDRLEQEKRYREEEPLRRQLLAQQLADEQRLEEERRAERQRREERDLLEEEQKEREEARWRRQQARQEEESRQVFLDGIKGLGDALVQGAQKYQNTVQAGIDIQNEQRRENARKQRAYEEAAKKQADEQREAAKQRRREQRELDLQEEKRQADEREKLKRDFEAKKKKEEERLLAEKKLKEEAEEKARRKKEEQQTRERLAAIDRQAQQQLRQQQESQQQPQQQPQQSVGSRQPQTQQDEPLGPSSITSWTENTLGGCQQVMVRNNTERTKLKIWIRTYNVNGCTGAAHEEGGWWIGPGGTTSGAIHCNGVHTNEYTPDGKEIVTPRPVCTFSYQTRYERLK